MFDEDNAPESKAWLYPICPLSVAEATYGKAVLLTDAMIAQVLDALTLAEGQTETGKKALDTVWVKMMDLWTKAPSIPTFDHEELVDNEDSW